MLTPEPLIILVDQNDNELGFAPKMEAHFRGLMHRAISVFIFNSKKEWLIQQRALSKYHTPGLWSNTCCSHPMPGESNIEAANRRLKEEMGLSTNISEIFTFTYYHQFQNGLIENEFDHIFIGFTDELPIINLDEVADYKYIDFVSLDKEINTHPDHYTYWFRQLYKKVNDFL